MPSPPSFTGTYYDDITTARLSNLTFLGIFDIKILAVDPSFARPPEFYEYERYVDRVFIGNHFGFQYHFTFGLILKGSADVPNFGLWRWTFVCDVDIVFPDGYVKSERVILGSELVDPLVYNYKEVSFPVTFTITRFNLPSSPYVNLFEDTFYGMHPPFTTLDLYEKIASGNEFLLRVEVFGLTGGIVQEADHNLTSDAYTDYEYTINTKLHSKGSTAGVQGLQLTNLNINGLPITDYTYLHVVDSNNYFYQTSSVDAKVQGTDDIFGGSVYNFIEANTLVTMERNIKNKGIIHSWQSSYPDDLDVTISKFDTTGRTITVPGGEFTEEELWQKYSFDSNIEIAGTPNNQSLAFNNLPTGYIQNTISSASLIANGDFAGATRLPFRAWWKPGADIYHSKNTILAGSGNSRTYNSPNRNNFSGYRYLDVTGGSATTSPEAGKLLITSDGSNVIIEKDLVWNTGSQTKRIDLCFGGLAHTNFPDLQGQDNPYPRYNASYPPAASGARIVNQDMYGIGQVGSLIATGNVNISQFKLTREDNTAKASFVAPFAGNQANAGSTNNGFVKVQTDSINRQYFGRRFWEQDMSGKNEEEYDLLQELTLDGIAVATTVKLSVQDLCDNINNRVGYQGGKIHTGWTASGSYNPSSSPGYLTYCFDKDNAYASWLNGFGMQNASGAQNFSILRDLSQESGDKDVYTQMIFDRINCNYPPDYFDPFQLEAPGETQLLLYSFSCLRSVAHGLVQEQQLGETVNLEDTSGNIFGQGITDVVGSYQTGLPGGLPENAARIGYSTGTIPITKLFTAKRFRGAFYVIPVPVGVNILSADISGFYQGCIGTINMTDVDLIFSSTPDFSTFDTLSTNITGMSNVAIAWLRPTNSNQMILATQRESDSAIIRYVLDDFVNGVASMGTVIGNGSTPAIAINGNGTQIIFWRTSSSNVARIIIDSAGNITTAASNVVTGNVSDSGLGCYWLDDEVFLVYNHTVNGLTVVKSDDYGQTFS
jgi:hypothetical protein